MRRRTSLVKYHRNLPARTSGTTLLIGAIIVALIIYFILKNKTSPSTQYSNEEKWDIMWSPEGLPLQVVIHRKAVRS